MNMMYLSELHPAVAGSQVTQFVFVTQGGAPAISLKGLGVGIPLELAVVSSLLGGSGCKVPSPAGGGGGVPSVRVASDSVSRPSGVGSQRTFGSILIALWSVIIGRERREPTVTLPLALHAVPHLSSNPIAPVGPLSVCGPVVYSAESFSITFSLQGRDVLLLQRSTIF